MRHIPDASVDACITDPPYGTTACSWDAVIPFAPMWVELKRIVKKNGAIVLFGSQPFTSALVMSNPQMFKYQWVWDKVNLFTNQMNASRQPMRQHEDVCVFYSEQPAYNPQKRQGDPYKVTRSGNIEVFGIKRLNGENPTGEMFPGSILSIKTRNPLEQGIHPTQKPVDLLRYLVRTYTNEGDTVLDFTCGSGTTGVACVIERRNFIGIERDPHYCEVSAARIKRAQGVGCDIPQRVRQYAPSPLFDGVLASESVA